MPPLQIWVRYSEEFTQITLCEEKQQINQERSKLWKRVSLQQHAHHPLERSSEESLGLASSSQASFLWQPQVLITIYNFLEPPKNDISLPAFSSPDSIPDNSESLFSFIYSRLPFRLNHTGLILNRASPYSLRIHQSKQQKKISYRVLRKLSFWDRLGSLDIQWGLWTPGLFSAHYPFTALLLVSEPVAEFAHRMPLPPLPA